MGGINPYGKEDKHLKSAPAYQFLSLAIAEA